MSTIQKCFAIFTFKLENNGVLLKPVSVAIEIQYLTANANQSLLNYY